MWPEYTPAAHGEGLRAVFAFPLQVGAVWLGAMNVYQAVPGALSARAEDRALTFANLATQMLLGRPRTPVRWPHLVVTKVVRLHRFAAYIPKVSPWAYC